MRLEFCSGQTRLYWSSGGLFSWLQGARFPEFRYFRDLEGIVSTTFHPLEVHEHASSMHKIFCCCIRSIVLDGLTCLTGLIGHFISVIFFGSVFLLILLPAEAKNPADKKNPNQRLFAQQFSFHMVMNVGVQIPKQEACAGTFCCPWTPLKSSLSSDLELPLVPKESSGNKTERQHSSLKFLSLYFSYIFSTNFSAEFLGSQEIP